MADDLVDEIEGQNLEIDISGIEPGNELYHIDESDVGKEVEVTQDERKAAEAVLSFHFYVNPDSGSIGSEKVRSTLEEIDQFRDEGVINPELEFPYEGDYLGEVERKLEDRNMNKKISELQKDDATERDDFVDMEEELINYLIGDKYSGSSSESSSRF